MNSVEIRHKRIRDIHGSLKDHFVTDKKGQDISRKAHICKWLEIYKHAIYSHYFLPEGLMFPLTDLHMTCRHKLFKVDDELAKVGDL